MGELPPLQITWSVLRPVAFLENFDDAKNGNPLTKGKLKMLVKPEASLKYISCTDIGKGCAALLLNPDLYAGQKIDAATCESPGPRWPRNSPRCPVSSARTLYPCRDSSCGSLSLICIG